MTCSTCFSPPQTLKWSTDLLALAERIARNREIAGLHYPSDSWGGLQLATNIKITSATSGTPSFYSDAIRRLKESGNDLRSGKAVRLGSNNRDPSCASRVTQSGDLPTRLNLLSASAARRSSSWNSTETRSDAPVRAFRIWKDISSPVALLRSRPASRLQKGELSVHGTGSEFQREWFTFRERAPTGPALT